IVIAILAIVFAVFAVLYLTGKIGDISGFTGEVSSDTGSAASSEQQSISAVSSQSTDNSSVSGALGTSSAAYSSAPESSQSSAVSSANSSADSSEPTIQTTEYRFRNKNLLDQHYQKHGIDMGFSSAEEYELAAAAVPNHPDVLHKTEKEDGDDVYYIEATNEFVVVSTDGYIRTYFNPDRGIDYYNKQ
ncbi:MAG: hypothetical protein K2J80_09480, partial [Oscillospiraceae bacterium]|nr:hypothetical protein [Oscillospiraceae bacterium]